MSFSKADPWSFVNNYLPLDAERLRDRLEDMTECGSWDGDYASIPVPDVDTVLRRLGIEKKSVNVYNLRSTSSTPPMLHDGFSNTVKRHRRDPAGVVRSRAQKRTMHSQQLHKVQSVRGQRKHPHPLLSKRGAHPAHPWTSQGSRGVGTVWQGRLRTKDSSEEAKSMTRLRKSRLGNARSCGSFRAVSYQPQGSGRNSTHQVKMPRP